MQGSVRDSRSNVLLIYNNHFNTTNQLACSPDGRYLATNTTRINLVQVWDIQTEALVSSHQCYRTRQGYVNALAWSPDGRYIASGQNGLYSNEAIIESFLAGRKDVSMDGTVEVWEALTGRTIIALEGFFGRAWAATPLAWSPDGSYLAFGNRAKRITVKKVVSDRTIAVHEGHSDWISSISWSPNGKYIASTCGDKTVHIWQALTGKSIDIYSGHNGAVHAVAWSPDSKYLASASHDGTVQIWVPIGGTIFTYRGHTGVVNAVAWSPDGNLLASSSEDGSVQVWEAQSGNLLNMQRDHARWVSALAWLSDGTSIASAGHGALVWKARTGERIARVGDALAEVHDMTLSPDGTAMASTSSDEIQVWDTRTGEKRGVYHKHGEENPSGHVASIAWSPRGTHIASVCSARGSERQNRLKGSIHIWQAEGQTFGELTCNWICHEDMVVDLCWSPDGHLLASASFDGTVQTWQAITGAPVQTYRGEGTTVNAVAWSPDGKLLAAALWHKSDRGLLKNSPLIQIWDAASGETITIYHEHTDAVQALAWSPDSSRIATAGSDQSVRVWNALTGETLFICHGCQDRVATVAWSPDGKLLAGGSWDKTARIWDAATGQHLYTYQGHTGIVKKVLWLPDSKTIASASYGVHIWRAVL